MRKIISLFQRNYDGDRLVRNEVVPGAEWVQAGEGWPTRKYDGTCCMINNGRLFKRYEVKVGGKAPADFEPAGDVDENTGKQQGWIPVGDGPEDQWHREAFYNLTKQYEMGSRFGDINGTYELVGPKIQGNTDDFPWHELVRHGATALNTNTPRDFDGLREWLRENSLFEGIVWHHDDGRMVKIKAKDFGLKRKPAPIATTA
jgi:hypothetical protein